VVGGRAIKSREGVGEPRLTPGGHHHSLSSLLSMLRRCSRAQRSQYVLGLPPSTELTQVNGTSELGAVLPQKSHVGHIGPVADMLPSYTTRSRHTTIGQCAGTLDR
jgi:hypothetical protein